MAQDQFILTNGKGEETAISDFLIIKYVIKCLYFKYVTHLIYIFTV